MKLLLLWLLLLQHLLLMLQLQVLLKYLLLHVCYLLCFYLDLLLINITIISTINSNATGIVSVIAGIVRHYFRALSKLTWYLFDPYIILLNFNFVCLLAERLRLVKLFSNNRTLFISRLACTNRARWCIRKLLRFFR